LIQHNQLKIALQYSNNSHMNKQIFVLLLAFCVCVTSFSQLAPNSPEQIWQARDYTSMRISSYDTTGANDDGQRKKKIQPNETRTIGNVNGPGIIKHIWITIASSEPHHLKKIVLRMYWDDNKTPSVEAPIGDFFGLGLGKYFLYESRFLSVGSQRALNCFFPMPFKKSARITVTNEGERAIDAFYYNIDWEKHPSLPDNINYFHAQYRQSVPTDGWTADWKLNADEKVDKKENRGGEGNYLIMEAEGKGHFVGVTHSIVQNQGDWWGEGDEMIYIDDEKTPTINGTGAEDYYLGAWCYGGCGINPFGNQQPTFAYRDYGNPKNGGDNRGAEWTVYRFHTESPVTFRKSIKMTIEHGHANHRSDNYYTVAYWYQDKPQATFPAFPGVKDRVIRLVNTEGPTNGK
jgi:hypothetical protein